MMALQDTTCVPDSCSDSHTSACVQGVGTSQAPADPIAVPIERLSSAAVPHDKVTTFVWSVIRHAIPAVSADAACMQLLSSTHLPACIDTLKKAFQYSNKDQILARCCRVCWVTQGLAEVCAELWRA